MTVQLNRLDHCHRTNKNRGLLCQWCNQGIGNFKEDPDRLIEAVNYLCQHSR